MIDSSALAVSLLIFHAMKLLAWERYATLLSPQSSDPLINMNSRSKTGL
jgi:hypothetical protein